MASVSQNMPPRVIKLHPNVFLLKKKILTFGTPLESYPSDPHTKIPKNSVFLIVVPFLQGERNLKDASTNDFYFSHNQSFTRIKSIKCIKKY